jgi:hypothetical protein
MALPGRVDVGEIAIRDSVIRRVRLANASVNGLRIDSARTHLPAFSVGRQRGFLRLRDTMLVPIRFLPPPYGITGDSIQIFSNAPGSRHCIPLTGMAPPPLLVTDMQAMQFGEIPSGEVGRLVLGISNNSVSPLSIDSLTTRTGIFQVEKFPISTHLRRGDTLRVQVRFLPVTAGRFQDTLVIANNSFTPRFRVFLSGAGRAVQVSGDLAGSFALLQNFPNPSNEMTTFRYVLPERCSVRLVVFNSLGQIIATIVDGEEDQGNHTVIWRPDAASGMHFFKLIGVPSNNPDRQHIATKRLMVFALTQEKGRPRKRRSCVQGEKGAFTSTVPSSGFSMR